MRKNRHNKGFTLAELMIVVAIVLILLGVGLLAFQRRQRSMTRLEYDTVAKEIFIAAQNHLTTAESQGYLGNEAFGIEGTLTEDKNAGGDVIVWFVTDNDGGSAQARNLMLPGYALDPTVLAGCYIVRYQPSAAKVLDVFYSKPGSSGLLTVSGVEITAPDLDPLDLAREYEALMGTTNPDNTGARERFTNSKGETGVVGWYGGENPVERGERLRVPSFEIINKELLLVKITDPNSELDYASMKMIVKGKTSGAQKVFALRNVTSIDPDADRTTAPQEDDKTKIYTVVLDDITGKKTHFADLTPGSGTFRPGEDITVSVVAYSNSVLTNVAMSAEQTTNSLFADPGDSDITNGTAGVRYFRHLENLSPDISKVAVSDLSLEKAKQFTDLDWSRALREIRDLRGLSASAAIKIYYSTSETGTNDNTYMPVNPGAPLDYDGQGHSIAGVVVNAAADAGLFGTLPYGSKKSSVENLQLLNFRVTGSGPASSAGALAGKANAHIANVLVRNTVADDQSYEINASGSAGGLVGSMTGGTVTNCAAAVYVKGATAGGLIGTADSGSIDVTGCYSGGHTSDGKYLDTLTGASRVNVIGTTAGGLIGSSGATVSVGRSYSTCSVAGATAGGFVGVAAGGTVSSSYCTGLVLAVQMSGGNAVLANVEKESPVRAFVGSGSLSGGTSDTRGNWYYATVNDRYYTKQKLLTGSSYSGVEELVSGTDAAHPFDKDRLEDGAVVTAYEAYMTFFPENFPAKSVYHAAYEASPYDTWLKNQYKKSGDTTYEYAFPTVSDLGAEVIETPDADHPASDFVFIHYGDWPAMETRVINA